MSTYISAANIIATNLQAPNPPKSITVTKNGKSETYTRTYLSYNYGSSARPYLAEALFELQICKGKVKKNKKGDIKLNLSITNEADLAGLSQLSLGFAYVVQRYKGSFGMQKFDPQNPGNLRGAFFYPAVEGTGEIIEGAAPIVSLKMNEKTRFKVLKPKINPETHEPIYINGIPDFDEEVIDYKSLIDKQLDCSVVINARDLYYSGGMPLPQIFVRSCMILNMSDSGEVEHTKSEMVRNFLQQNPEVLNTLAEQIAKLKVGGVSTASLLQPVDTSKSEPPINLPAAQPLPQPPSAANSPAPVTTPSSVQVPQGGGLNQLNQLSNTLPGLTMPQTPAVPLGSTQFQLPMAGTPAIPQGNLDITAFLTGQQQLNSGQQVNLQRI